MSGTVTAYAGTVLEMGPDQVNSVRPGADGLASPRMPTDAFGQLVDEVARCAPAICRLAPYGHAGLPSAQLLIISRAPGTPVHETGLPFNRAGDRLRDWLGIDRGTFSDEMRRWVMGNGFPLS
jgi:uracil-DNA glycosylase